jgi:hypothetical protein
MRGELPKKSSHVFPSHLRFSFALRTVYTRLSSGKLTTALAPLSGGQTNVLEPSRLTSASPEPTIASESESVEHRYFDRPPSGTTVSAPAEMQTAHRRQITEVPPHTVAERTARSTPTRNLEFPLLFPQPSILAAEPFLAADDPAQSRYTSQGATAPTSNYHFNVEWLSLDRVSFRQTRNYRNSWNHGREIKISRDGTELDPKTGKRLIEQWKTLSLAG